MPFVAASPGSLIEEQYMKIFDTLPDSPDQPVALTIGNFDGVHRGHQAMLAALKRAAYQRRLPACVMTFEPHPREFLCPDNAPYRLTTLKEKASLLSECGVDQLYVCQFDDEVANMPAHAFVSRLLAEQLRTQWLLVGDDFRFGARRRGDLALLQELGKGFGFEVASLSTVEDCGERISSTAVREAMARGDSARLAALLGRPWLLPREFAQAA
jgi:riboflavin kinase/FMN adenylyltransferase